MIRCYLHSLSSFAFLWELSLQKCLASNALRITICIMFGKLIPRAFFMLSFWELYELYCYYINLSRALALVAREVKGEKGK